MSKARQNKGFTLIELLVVIAIIAILAAILFPVFAQARESARQTGCLSNEKQISLGILQYVQDYDERYPIWMYDNNPTPPTADPNGGKYQEHHMGWDEICQPYIKSKSILWCPSVDSPGNDYNNKDKSDSDWTGSSNYATNCRIGGKYNNPSPGVYIPVKLATLSYPSMTILLSENGAQSSEGACRIENDEWGWTGSQADAMAWQAFDSTKRPGPLSRHKGGANYAFADGHAKWINAKNLGLTYDNNNVTVSNTSIVQKIMDDSGNNPTYHLGVGN